MLLLGGHAGFTRDVDSIPGSGRSPGVGSGNPLQYSCLKILRTEEPGGLQSMEQLSAHKDLGWTHSSPASAVDSSAAVSVSSDPDLVLSHLLMPPQSATTFQNQVCSGDFPSWQNHLSSRVPRSLWDPVFTSCLFLHLPHSWTWLTPKLSVVTPPISSHFFPCEVGFESY